MKLQEGAFLLSANTIIIAEQQDPDIQQVARCLATLLEDRLRHPIAVARSADDADSASGRIVLHRTKADPTLGDEGYRLRIAGKRIDLRAPATRGLFYGVQTLRQLLPVNSAASHATAPALKLPALEIVDRPRFAWRGMMLDCGRHFMSKEFVKRYIDLLAFHKMNVLHWHLTEDQGWRLEIKKYSKLTEVGAWRYEDDQPYGGFYTQEDVREIVAYAAERFVAVIPEIEMPGHCRAALASYPELSCSWQAFEVSTRWGVHGDVYCAGNEWVFTFLQDVLSEVFDLFPSKYVHIGGDECPKGRWKACPQCQARIRAENLKDEDELQSYFIRRIARFAQQKGRRIIGWDEILEGGLAPNATVQSWRGLQGAVAAAEAGHDAIVSPTSHCYLDYAQERHPGEPTWMGYIDLQKAYSFEPVPSVLAPEEAGHILGLEGNIWTEHAPQHRVDWQVFPRLCALAEVAWSPKEARDFRDFKERMTTHYHRLDALGVTYFIPAPRQASAHQVFSETIDVVLENPFDRGIIRYTLDGATPTASSSKYEAPFSIAESTTINARTILDHGHMSAVAEFAFLRQQPREPEKVSNLRPGLTYEYHEGSWRHLPEFDKLEPSAQGIAAAPNLDVRKREDEFAVRFSGYFSAPADGVYAFHLISDDGSRLRIGKTVVVDHDGLHGASERSGEIILRQGMHSFTIEFFEAGGAERLEVYYEGPGLTRQPIPPSVFWHAEKPR
jgi:hexosaminidase